MSDISVNTPLHGHSRQPTSWIINAKTWLTQQPVGFSARLPKAKWLPGWGHSPNHQHSSCLKTTEPIFTSERELWHSSTTKGQHPALHTSGQAPAFSTRKPVWVSRSASDTRGRHRPRKLQSYITGQTLPVNIWALALPTSTLVAFWAP